MLIVTPRHRPADLTLWQEYEAADREYARSHQFSAHVAAAKQRIREWTRQHKRCYAAVSWGKDSLVLAHLLWLISRDVPLVHLQPSNANPETDLVSDAYFRRHPGQRYVVVPVDYTHIDRRRVSSVELDRLTDREWYRAWRGVSKQWGPHYLIGIRAEESRVRRLRFHRWGAASTFACAPIVDWSCDDVFAYLALYELPVHPAYAYLGSGRWRRERIRVAEIGDTCGSGGGRREWESEYYGDLLRRMIATGYCAGTTRSIQRPGCQ